jgi:hypothetical protein
MKVRASALAKMMATPRSKGELLSQTAKSYIKEVVLQDKYGIYKEFNSRYTDKGTQTEDEAIQLVSEVMDLGFVLKNEEKFENEFIKGTPDVITEHLIIDTKVSWSAATFPFFENELPNSDYYWQMQAYMWLTGKRASVVAYCLINTPYLILEDEIRREHWKQNVIGESDEIRAYVEAQHNFDHIPKDERVRLYLVDYNEQDIERAKEKIQIGTVLYNQLMNQ